MAKKDIWFGGAELEAKERAILEQIDASRVRSFIDSLKKLMAFRDMSGVSIEDLEAQFEVPDSSREQTELVEHLHTRTNAELLWAGMTVEGLGVGYIGTGAIQGASGTRKIPSLGLITDPQTDRPIIVNAKLWAGNASDGFDAGWDQRSYLASDRNGKVRAYKPIEEWGISRTRGNYSVSLLHDPHFMYNDEVHRAEVLVTQTGFASGLQATLGHDLLRTDDGKTGYPAYNFERQITPKDMVVKMNFAVLRSYVSD